MSLNQGSVSGRGGVVAWVHDSDHGRHADHDTGANQAGPAERAGNRVQGGRAGANLPLDRVDPEAVQILRAQPQRQGPAESLPSAPQRPFARAVDPPAAQVPPGGRDTADARASKPLPRQVHERRQGTAGADRQRTRAHVGPRDAADLGAGVRDLRGQALRARAGHFCGPHLPVSQEPRLPGARTDVHQDAQRVRDDRRQ